MYRILAIDGGGIRGVIPSVVLAEIERRIGKPLHQTFDMIAGTSIGGIIAVGLAAPSRNRPGTALSAQDLVDLLTDHGGEIFERSFWDGLTNPAGVFDELYSADNLERIVGDFAGDTQLNDVLTELLVTSFEIEKHEPYLFKSSKATAPERNHFLRDVARATSAAPTYFEPAVVRTVDGHTRRVLIDGGVFANNPALCGYTEARKKKQPPDDILIVSIGTGITTRSIPYEKAKDWGKAGWAVPMIGVFMDGAADAVHHHLLQLLPGPGESGQRYFRFNIPLTEALDDLDAAHAANISALKREGERILDRQGAELAELIRLL